MQNVERSSPSLVTITACFIAISAAVAGLFFYLIVNERIKTVQSEALATAVTTRVQGVQLSFARALFSDWEALKSIADRLETMTDKNAATKMLDAIVYDGNRVSWAGYARVDGSVEAASRGMLLQADVSSRPWFQRGLEGPFAGDVHEAVLLAKLINSSSDEPVRFIDLSVPVLNDVGDTQGVVGLHVNLDWARGYLSEIASALGIDVFLINRAGEVVVASDGQSYAGLNLPSIRAAQSGAAATVYELWPDGQRYFSATYPEVTYQDLPSFGWSIVARIPETAVTSPQNVISSTVAWSLGWIALMLLLLSLLFIQAFIVPLKRLAQNAEKIAEGRNVYPYQTLRTSEYRAIGAALARLQVSSSGTPAR